MSLPLHVVTLPPLRSLAVHAGRHLLEATVVPLGLFYLLVEFLGLYAALAGALAWSYAALVRRVVRRERIPGILLLATLLVTLRAVVSFATGSVFLWFLQPTLGTYLVAGLFLVSVPLGKPLAQRLAHDFCPLPDSLLGDAAVRRFFLRVSLLWALVYLANASATLGLLLTTSLGQFMVAKSAFTSVLFVSAVAVSVAWFRRSLGERGVVLRWARHTE